MQLIASLEARVRRSDGPNPLSVAGSINRGRHRRDDPREKLVENTALELLQGPMGWGRARVAGQYGTVRIAVSVSLTIAATVLGLFGALMLGVSGLSWAGPGFTIIEYSDSDDGERSIGIGMGTIALATWLVGVMSAALVGLRGERLRTPQRATVWILVGASAVLVVGLTIGVLSTPPPVSEYPLPEWNRA